ncbi:RNA polymerase sigma factor [Nonomuraea sp. MCN248]|uniref:RNA polymerase sigma factor n=1 Tax=Nonomuraea corallina TaxID=2989783 RepID=A0ABT4S5N0_9ACTN|nr:RNA polymerase sigma factor [Nonomuraea corallina]MDA0632330.1 RNA polymerase sigma factor [Nonomuraea corallina]
MERMTRARIREGDARAFEQLYDEFARSVYGYALRLTGDWSTAEDVMSLTFLEAWRLRERVDHDGGSLRPWLLGIATNVARNTRRASRRYHDALARLPPGDDASDFADELVERMDDKERVTALRRAYGSLRRPEQEVIALVAGSGLSYAEAAEALGTSVGTVKSRLSRARKKLKRAAGPERTWPQEYEPITREA